MKTLILLFLSLSVQARVTVSGLSSGAYMAQQFHTAFSASVSGVGVLAGGPYFCAKGSVVNALNRCMKTSMGMPVVSESTAEAKRLERTGGIDPLKNMKNARVYLFAGTLDETVLPQVMTILSEQYQSWGVIHLLFENNLRAGHAFPTEGFGNSCETVSASPWISNCQRDIAGEMLNHIAGPLRPKLSARNERFFKFDQPQLPRSGFHKEGFAYVPEGCEKKKSECDIHVAFHGCHQSVTEIGSKFYLKAGYNDWAEGNKLIVLYPQIVKDPVLNPNGCWDWWGYASKDYHTKNGVQMKVIMGLVQDVMKRSLRFQRLSP